MLGDYLLGIDFDDHLPPLTRLLALVENTNICSNLGQFVELRIFENQNGGSEDSSANLSMIEIQNLLFTKTPKLADLQQQLQPYAGERYMIEAIFKTQRYIVESPLHPEDYRIRFFIKGQQFVPQPYPFIPHVLLEVGSGHLYDINTGDGIVFEKNLHLLLSELECITNMKVKSIYGFDDDMEEYPSSYWLCYHNDPIGFIKDIYRRDNMPTNLFHLTSQAILDAAQTCEYIETIECRNGILAYNVLGVTENLNSFYEVLRKRFRK